MCCRAVWICIYNLIFNESLFKLLTLFDVLKTKNSIYINIDGIDFNFTQTFRHKASRMNGTKVFGTGNSNGNGGYLSSFG